jgi:hypothetical protein
LRTENPSDRFVDQAISVVSVAAMDVCRAFGDNPPAFHG